LIKDWWKTIYHAWDTALTMDMKLLWDYEKLDLSFVPIWWNFTMWIDDAIIACSFIKSKIVVPIHYDTFDIIKVDAWEFARKLLQENYWVPKLLVPWQEIVL
jgi:L-ascorbate metabolism protein UlaG (beta-lactamase superfamily)